MSFPANDSPADASARPTRVRYKVITLAVLLAMVTYLDRVCISNLAPNIMADLGLEKWQMAWVFSAFTLAYALFEIPTGRLADRWGTRRVLTRIVVWWSAFTLATAGAFNWVSLLVTRFLFGAGEAGAWPSATSTFARWVPAKRRGTVQSIFFAGALLSGGVTPLLVHYLADEKCLALSWRAIFVVFGLVGLVWAAVWYWWYRDDPSEHPEVNQAELEVITAGRPPASSHHTSAEDWRRLFSHSNTWLLCVMYLGNTSAYYFCISWLPTYLKERLGLEGFWLAIAAGLPLTLSVAGSLLGGFTTDWATRRLGPKIGRCGVGAAAYVVAALAMLLAANASRIFPDSAMAATVTWVIVISLALATAGVEFILGAAWGTCIDIGGRNAGVVSATMNTAGAINGFFVPIVGAALQARFGWDGPLWMIATVLAVATVAWLFIDPRKRIFE